MQEAEVEAELAADVAYFSAAVQEVEPHNVVRAAQQQLQLVVQYAELPGVLEHSQKAVLEAVHEYGQAAAQEAELACVQEGPYALAAVQAAVQKLVVAAVQNAGQEAELGLEQAAVQEYELTAALNTVQKLALEAV